MQKYWLCLGIILFVSCSKSDVLRNPNLGEIRFSHTIDLNLPLYNALKYPQNTIYLPNIGLKGVFVTNVGNDRFYAWESACPNHSPTACQALRCASKIGDTFEICTDETSKSYIFVKCMCDGSVYNLVNGNLISASSDERYPLLNYSVSVAGTRLIINN